MKNQTLFMYLVLAVSIFVLSGCARPAEDIVISDEKAVSATAQVQSYVDELPLDIPIHPDAEKIKFAAGNTYITYEVPGDVDSIVEYYRTELEVLGWEKRGGGTEKPIGDSLTMLRIKPDKNISITIQGIPASGNVRVLISVIQK